MNSPKITDNRQCNEQKTIELAVKNRPTTVIAL